jgi:transcription elongation factor Elf1
MDNYNYIEFHCPHCGKYIYLCVYEIEKEIHEEKYSCSCSKSFDIEYDRVLAELNIKVGMYLKDK